MKIAFLFSVMRLTLSACTTTKNIKETPATDDALAQRVVAFWEGSLP